MLKKIINFVCVLFFALFLSACGGGSDAPQNTEKSANWDEMSWDKSNWK